MKTKQKARDRREAAKISWSPPKLQTPAPQPQPPAPGERARMKAERKKTEAEETREFLEYIGKIDMKIVKEEERDSVSERRKTGKSIQVINLEEGMPVVEDAIRRMNLAIQECRSSGIRKVKLIHGYGSTGKGGKICAAVRSELAGMKRRRLVKEYICGEAFGPFDAASRMLADQDRNITMDSDYGRGNHGITIVIL